MSLFSGTGRISDAETEKTVRAAKLYHRMSPRQRQLLAQVSLMTKDVRSGSFACTAQIDIFAKAVGMLDCRRANRLASTE